MSIETKVHTLAITKLSDSQRKNPCPDRHSFLARDPTRPRVSPAALSAVVRVVTAKNELLGLTT